MLPICICHLHLTLTVDLVAPADNSLKPWRQDEKSMCVCGCLKLTDRIFLKTCEVVQDLYIYALQLYYTELYDIKYSNK